MLGSGNSQINAAITKFNSDLDRFTDHLRNQAIRAGVAAACVPIKSAFASFAANYVGKKPPVRRDRKSGATVVRPRLRDSITSKVWKFPNGKGYAGFIGPVSIQVPHAHWFGDKAPTDRYTKAGKYRGTHLSHKGGPARLLSKTWNASIDQAIAACETAIAEKINSFQEK